LFADIKEVVEKNHREEEMFEAINKIDIFAYNFLCEYVCTEKDTEQGHVLKENSKSNQQDAEK